MKKFYFGFRKPGEVKVYVGTPMEYTGGNVFGVPLPHVGTHSPDGFEWGYGESGPADLALSILADFTGDEAIAKQHYQRFKDEIVARLPKAQFAITGELVKKWLEKRTKA